MTTKKLKQAFFRQRDDGVFEFWGKTEKGSEIQCEFRIDDIHRLACAFTTLANAATKLVESQRREHKWARDRIATNWREINAAIGEEVKP